MGFYSKAEVRERGQSLVEFALVLPVVLLLIFGLLEFGRVLNGLVSAYHCANSLARVALVGKSEADTVSVVADYCPTLPAWTITGDQITVSPDSADRALGSTIQVTVYYPVELIVPGIRNLIAARTVEPPGGGSVRREHTAPGAVPPCRQNSPVCPAALAPVARSAPYTGRFCSAWKSQ